MQGRQGNGSLALLSKRVLVTFSNVIIVFVVILGGVLLLYSDTAYGREMIGLHRKAGASRTVAVNGAAVWEGDEAVTAPRYDFPAASSHAIAVSALFRDYYNSHHGPLNLGAPLTVAFPVAEGWMQFFESDALLLPSAGWRHSHAAEDPLRVLIARGTVDNVTGVVRLPMVQSLLTVGGEVPVAGTGGSLTYVDLRKATNPGLMQLATGWHVAASASSVQNQGVFVEGGTRDGKAVGHIIPPVIWNYINRVDVSPDGWRVDYGDPLTEALAFAVTKNGTVHHMLVQMFWRAGLIVDEGSLDASGQPEIHQLEAGLAYLRTLGPPAVTISPQQGMWTQSEGDVTPFDAPGGHMVAHIGPGFPLVPLGDTSWQGGMLWYHVQWGLTKPWGTGWVAASSVSFTAPGGGPLRAAIDALSPELSAYLDNLGGSAAVAVYDVTHQSYYTYDADEQFITGSSMKVPIMLTLLDMTERAGREPDDAEMGLLTRMIENSDNDAASALYYGEIGGAAGVASFLQRIGVSGIEPDDVAWGYSGITPMAMVNLLTRLYDGDILTAHDRALAFYLMEHIEYDQQVGVGDTAPDGVTVAMKDGWLPGPDGLWNMNSSGIVMARHEVYIIAVYSEERTSLDDGHAVVQHVCGAVARQLLG